MTQPIMEVGVKYVITRWKEKFGTQPDINSPEFKQFQKEVNRNYNQKTQEKELNDSNVEVYCKKLEQIIAQTPQNFPKEFYNALTNLSKKGKVNMCNMMLQSGKLPEDSKTWIQIIGNLYNNNKTESAEFALKAMFESAKYPWINKLVNQRLFKEDDFNLDNFDASVAGVGGMNTATKDTSLDGSTSDNSTTSNTQQGQENDDFNLDDFANAGGTDDLHIDPAGGAIDSIGGGMGLGDEEDPMAAVDPNAPTYRVIDVIFNDKDPEASPRVKVQNIETGEVEVKDIFEIDV